jgi:hypothetical protein
MIFRYDRFLQFGKFIASLPKIRAEIAPRAMILVTETFIAA